MNIHIFPTYEEMTHQLADAVINLLRTKPQALLCFAGGDSPKGLFSSLIQAENNKKVDFSLCSFVSLDEWVGLGMETKGSCIETLYNQFFNHISISKDQIIFFDGTSSQLDQECRRVDDFIFQKGGIDMIVLGIGMNGHIGFNEPNINPDQYSMVVPLDPITQEVSVKYFDRPMPVEQGISLGMKHILKAKNIILMANGLKKASILREALKVDISPQNPASLLRQNANFSCYLDTEAASLLS